MSFEISCIGSLTPYVTSKHRAWERRYSGGQVLKLDWNESTIPPSPLVKQRIIHALDEIDFNWYPDVENVDLRLKIARYVGVDYDFVDYFASSDSLHEYILQCFADHNTNVLMFYPTYDNFRAVAESHGALVTRLPIELIADSGFGPIANSSADIVYLCNPNNPTGHQLTANDLGLIFRQFPKKLFIIDEAYFEFTGETVAHLVPDLENVIICRTFSKAFGIASFRVGYAIAHRSLISSLRKVKNHKNVTSLSQIAASACLDDIDYMRGFVSEVLEAKLRFSVFLKHLSFINVVYDGGGNFLMFSIDEGLVDSLVVYLESRDIFVRSFSHLPGRIRITIGTIDQMKIVETAFSEFSLGCKI